MIDWNKEKNHLVKEFSFKNFTEVMRFVNKVADLAEHINHHPDIYIYNYKQVRLSLTTHHAGDTLTDKDYNLAEQIDNLMN